MVQLGSKSLSLAVVHNSRAHHFHADGKIGSPFTIYSQDEQRIRVLSCKLTCQWRLAHDGILSGLEEIAAVHKQSLFDTIPKLIRSEEAWTCQTWMGSRVPDTFVLIQTLDGTRLISNSLNGMLLPPELLGAIFSWHRAAQVLTLLKYLPACDRYPDLLED